MGKTLQIFQVSVDFNHFCLRDINLYYPKLISKIRPCLQRLHDLTKGC